VAGIYLDKAFSNTILDSGDYPWIGALGLNTNPVVGAYCPNGTTTCPTYGSNKAWYSAQPVTHRDQALFGELYYDFMNYELTVGARAYKQKQDGSELEDGALNFAYLNVPLPQTKQQGVDPKVALSYKFTPELLSYLSYSKGFRSGGAGVPLPGPPAGSPPAIISAVNTFLAAIHQTVGNPTTFNSDTIENYEIGAKYEDAEHGLIFTAAAFQMNWNNIQQTIIAPVSYITLTVNAGDARVRGGEFELQGSPTKNLDLRAGVGYEDAVITHGVLWWQPSGSAVYQVPKVTASTSGTFTVPLSNGLNSFYTLSASYTGSSVSGTMGCQENTASVQVFPCASIYGPGNPPERAGFTQLNARLGVNWPTSQLALYLNNLTNARPNLGDYNPESYAKHSTDPADFDPAFGVGYVVPRVATLQPFNLGVEYRHSF